MKKTFHLKLFIAVLFTLPTTMFSQSEFKVSTTIRPRFEFRDGYKSLKKEGHKPAAFVNQRSRLRIDFQNDKLITRFTIFDYRVWGDQVWKKDVPSAGIHEVWADLKLTENSRLKLGRQSVQYDDGRLIASVNWNQVGAAHDAAVYMYSKNGFELDLLTAWNQNKANTTGTDYVFDGESGSLNYKNLNVLWLSKKMSNTKLSWLSILDGYEEIDMTGEEVINDPNQMNYRYTTGIIFKQKAGSLGLKARGFYQGGKLYTGTDVKAYYLNAEAAYSFNKKGSVVVGFEVFSGNDHSDVANSNSNAFDILYGSRHKFNGRIDYFSAPSTTKQAGLVNPYAKFDYSFENKTKLSLEYHQFFLHKNYLPENNSQSVNKFLGNEFDLTIKKKVNDYISIEGGYSVLLGTESMELLKGGDKDTLNNWAFVMLTVNPTLFISKND